MNTTRTYKFILFLLLQPVSACFLEAQIPFQYEIIDTSGPLSPWGKSTCDINNDGLPDLLVGGWSDGGLVWYENPEWTKHQISNDQITTDVETADIDNDGTIDVAAISENSIQWYKNPTWGKTVIETDISLHDIEVADLNNDGKIDLIGRGQKYGLKSGKIVHLFIQGENASDWIPKTFSCPDGEGLKVFDINQDGKPDIIIGGIWYENTGDMSQWLTHTFSTSWTYPHAYIAIGDINSDGSNDIVLSPSEMAGSHYKIAWYEHPIDPNSKWIEHIVVDSVETVHHFVGAADFNNDGYDDIATAQMQQGEDPDEIAVYINQGDGDHWLKQIIATTGSHNMRIVDIDQDGDMDLFGANWNYARKIELWVNKTDVFNLARRKLDNWKRHVIDPAKDWRSIFVDGKDLNGDSLKDIITGGWWYENPGNLELQWIKHPIGTLLNNMAYIYDFDNDGDMDILGTKGDGNSFYPRFVWAENDNLGNFTLHDNIENAQGDFLQGVALIRKNEETPFRVALSWHTAGYGIQTLIVPVDPINDTWEWEKISDESQDECLTAGDINRDGNPDLLMGTEWLENDSNDWILQPIFETTDLPDRNKLADINQDGMLDAVVGYEAISIVGKLAWYEQHEKNTEDWTEHLIANVVGPMSMDAVDMDEDSDIDVVVGEHNLQEPDSAHMYVFENLDGKGIYWLKHEVFQGDENHDGAVTVDIDNDGDLDILSIGWGHNKVLLYENLNIVDTTINFSSNIELPKPLKIYPNPVTDKFKIRISIENPGKIMTTIYSSIGQLIYYTGLETVKHGEFQKEISTSNWPPGIYLVRVQTDTQFLTSKILLE